MAADDLSRLIASAARAIEHEVGAQDTIEKIVELAVKLIDDCDHAGISLRRPGRIESPVVSDDLVRRIDVLQHEHGEGPCVDARVEEELVHSSDIAADERWPSWGPRTVEETGVCSVMCFRLFTTGDVIGALSLYSSGQGVFDADDRELGLALAAHAAIAMSGAHQIDTLHLAVDGRTVIGQALGILMERFDIDADQAFALLKRLSQDSNRRIRDLALELVATRKMPPA